MILERIKFETSFCPFLVLLECKCKESLQVCFTLYKPALLMWFRCWINKGICSSLPNSWNSLKTPREKKALLEIFEKWCIFEKTSWMLVQLIFSVIVKCIFFHEYMFLVYYVTRYPSVVNESRHRRGKVLYFVLVTHLSYEHEIYLHCFVGTL